MAKASNEKTAKAAAGEPKNRKAFTKGLVQSLSTGAPGEYYDTRSDAGLGLRVGKSGKASYFVRFQHAGRNFNHTLGSVPGSSTSGKALPPLQLDSTKTSTGARDAARLYRTQIENPIDAEEHISLRAAFDDYVANKRVNKNGQLQPLADASKRGYLEVFSRYCEHLAERDFRSINWRQWEVLRNEITANGKDGKEIERGGVVLMQKPQPERKPHPLLSSSNQARLLFAALSGMYRRNKVNNPIKEMEVDGAISNAPARTNSVLVPELPQFFSVLRSLRSPVAAGFFLITLLTGWRRQAILKMEREALDCDTATYTTRDDMPGWKRAPPGAYPLGQWLVERVLRPRKSGYTPGPFLFPNRSRKSASGAQSKPLVPARDRSPNLQGCINSLQRDFGRRLTPNDVRRSFASVGTWIGINSLNLAAITGHSVKEPGMKRETAGERTLREHYVQLPSEELRRDAEDIVSAILECAGELPLSALVRAKLERTYPEHLAALERLAVNASSERRPAALTGSVAGK